ncbi:hypothetical protein AUR64_16185 [Haloprofundus marisrubri]|uniref:DUF7993 domain-containing protein n=1 Tax=Haloprofundus marisrubri TaxID=1514971 RepID=A0A0W1R8A7_9EURY|nr:hypothetical protein [Haloprofundus marisrubri]KTG09319.1 hypothetical protein AUR64_16185 [Haloprofundus marisrubri]
MADDHLADGKRIAQLLASELEGGGSSDRLRVADADPDVEATADGAFAYAVDALASDAESDADGGDTDGDHDDHDDAETETRLAEVFVQSDRARVEFLVDPAVAVDAAENANLRVRPKAVRPPRTLVFVEDGAQVKWILPVFEAVLAHEN